MSLREVENAESGYGRMFIHHNTDEGTSRAYFTDYQSSTGVRQTPPVFSGTRYGSKSEKGGDES